MEKFFEAGFASQVAGFRLADNREVVIKVRRFFPRLQGCAEVHRKLWERGYPCPEPLTDPMEMNGVWLTAEAYLPGGAPLVDDPLGPELYAAELARLMELAPRVESLSGLRPSPAYAYPFGANGRLWSETDFSSLTPDAGPQWFDETAARVRTRLLKYQADAVVGHADWWSQNLRWNERQLLAVDDWDSITALPEALLAGFASYMFAKTTFEIAGSAPGASIEETRRFLSAYELASSRQWTAEDFEVAWAAGSLVQLYDCKLTAPLKGGAVFLSYVSGEITQRLERAGVSSPPRKP